VAEAGIVGFRINFALDSDAIEPAYRIFIERIGALMKEEPQVKLRIEGHTDATGPDDYNLGLSTRRGVAVAAYLVDRMGIDPDRLVVAGKGKTEPMTADPYDPRNRRVQFVRVQ
jgi:outer membrane protein OmpA-like peptidoglycan-associated protein